MKRYSIACLLLLWCSNFLVAQNVNIKWVRNSSFKSVEPYSYGMAAYTERGKWGFLGESGDILLYHNYDEVREFQGDFCIVKEGGKYGVINKAGRYVHPCVYEYLSDFFNNVALGKKDGTMYYVYLNGKTRPLNKKYEYGTYSEGFVQVKSLKNGKLGYADSKGVVRINMVYDAVSDFKNGNAVVQKKGKWYSINKKGDKKRTKVDFSLPYQMFDEGAGCVKVGERYRVFTDNFKYVSGEYLEVNPTSEGLIRVKDASGVFKYLNKKGREVIVLSDVEDCGDFSEEKAWIKKGGKYGYIDKDGRVIINPTFANAGSFSNGLAHVVKQDDKSGFIKIADKDDKFPRMTVTKIALADDNGNNKVEPGEKFRIRVTIKNDGDDILIGGAVSLKFESSDILGLNMDGDHKKMGSLPQGGTRVVYFSGFTNQNLSSGEVKLSFTCSADNVLTQITVPFKFSVGN